MLRIRRLLDQLGVRNQLAAVVVAWLTRLELKTVKYFGRERSEGNFVIPSTSPVSGTW